MLLASALIFAKRFLAHTSFVLALSWPQHSGLRLTRGFWSAEWPPWSTSILNHKLFNWWSSWRREDIESLWDPSQPTFIIEKAPYYFSPANVILCVVLLTSCLYPCALRPRHIWLRHNIDVILTLLFGAISNLHIPSNLLLLQTELIEGGNYKPRSLYFLPSTLTFNLLYYYIWVTTEGWQYHNLPTTFTL